MTEAAIHPELVTADMAIGLCMDGPEKLAAFRHQAKRIGILMRCASPSEGCEIEEQQAVDFLYSVFERSGLLKWYGEPEFDDAMREGIERRPAPLPYANGHRLGAAPPIDETPPPAGPEDYGAAAEPPPAQAAGIQAMPYEWRAADQIKRREWLYGRHYIRRFASTTIGRPGLGKSALAIAEMLDMVSGRSILDQLDRAPLRVWYIGEDPADEIERRIAAACVLHRLEPEDVAGRLFVNSTLDLPPVLIAQQGARGPVVNSDTTAQLAREITARQVDVLILDPLIKFHAVPEADPSAMEAVMRALSELASATGAAVEVLHHTRKQAPGMASPATVDDGRGASSIIGAVRSARVLNSMSQQDAERAGIAEADRWRYARIDPGKANMAPPEAARWVQHASEILPCGESVGVVAPWQFPDAFAGFSAADLPRIRELARTGAYRNDARSPEWFGRPVADLLRLDIDDKRDRARVGQMVKTWIKNKVLDIETRPDEQRRPREFIVPGPYSPLAEAAE